LLKFDRAALLEIIAVFNRRLIGETRLAAIFSLPTTNAKTQRYFYVIERNRSWNALIKFTIVGRGGALFHKSFA
jgi:hypothetical protein